MLGSERSFAFRANPQGLARHSNKVLLYTRRISILKQFPLAIAVTNDVPSGDVVGVKACPTCKLIRATCAVDRLIDPNIVSQGAAFDHFDVDEFDASVTDLDR